MPIPQYNPQPIQPSNDLPCDEPDLDPPTVYKIDD